MKELEIKSAAFQKSWMVSNQEQLWLIKMMIGNNTHVYSCLNSPEFMVGRISQTRNWNQCWWTVARCDLLIFSWTQRLPREVFIASISVTFTAGITWCHLLSFINSTIISLEQTLFAAPCSESRRWCTELLQWCLRGLRLRAVHEGWYLILSSNGPK